MTLANLLALIAAVIVLVIIYAFDWGVTVGILYLVYHCFGWEWSWLVATGIWLIMLLARSVFKSYVNRGG